MSEGMNRVTLFGNLGADPDLRYGQGGADSACLRLRIATTDSYFHKGRGERVESTEWHNVVIFGKRAEALQKILKKGSRVLIEGRLQTKEYEKDGERRFSTDVVAQDLILADRAPAGRAPKEDEDEDDDREEKPRGFGRSR